MRSLATGRIDVDTVASPLGSWTIARFAPRGPLANTLRSAWYFDGVLAYARERVFPSGIQSLVLQLDEPHARPNGAPFPAAVFEGMATHATIVEAPAGRTRVIGLECTAVGGFVVSGRAIGACVDEAVALRAVAADDGERLLDACRSATTPQSVLETAVRWYAANAEACERCDPLVLAAIERIRASRGACSIGELGADLGRSERAFTRAFRDRVGVLPKRFARIERFAHAHELVAHGDEDLASIADRAGYYDQAHFTQEFTAHAGLSPSRYRASLRYPSSRSVVERS